LLLDSIMHLFIFHRGWRRSRWTRFATNPTESLLDLRLLDGMHRRIRRLLPFLRLGSLIFRFCHDSMGYVCNGQENGKHMGYTYKCICPQFVAHISLLTNDAILSFRHLKFLLSHVFNASSYVFLILNLVPQLYFLISSVFARRLRHIHSSPMFRRPITLCSFLKWKGSDDYTIAHTISKVCNRPIAQSIRVPLIDLNRDSNRPIARSTIRIETPGCDGPISACNAFIQRSDNTAFIP